MKGHECALPALTLALALPWLALAGPPPAPTMAKPAASATADADLLEFLGSVDSDEAGWHDYLEHTDLEKVIRAPAKVVSPANQGNDQ